MPVRRAGSRQLDVGGQLETGRYPAVGEVGNQQRAAVFAEPDGPAQARFLTRHKFEHAFQSFAF